MYLKRLVTQDNGPLRRLDLTLPIDEAGQPRPVVLVGQNGSGKTNLLSIIADALVEGASVHYSDLVTPASGAGRNWFRVLGPITTSAGAQGAFSLLEFVGGDSTFIYKEKAGHLPAGDVQEGLPDELKPHASWPDDGPVKEFGISEDESRLTFARGAYAYFPSSRAEIPHWLNEASLDTPTADIKQRFSGRLMKPIYIERGLQELKKWMLSVLIDARTDFAMLPTEQGQVAIAVGNIPYAQANLAIWQTLNAMLITILGDPNARFVWTGRRGQPGLGFARSEQYENPLALDALSAGQATLLNIFTSLMRYGDQAAAAAEIEGICIIDEVDAHMHVDLQHRALPALIRMFPNMQFIMSSHSPLFVLGMEAEFGDDFRLIELPAGITIGAESYTEFARAISVFHETQSFYSMVSTVVSNESRRVLVMAEGQTDPEYLRAACELTGRSDLLDSVEFQWVGHKDPKTGQVFNSGVPALNSAVKLLRSNPSLAGRPVVLLYDNDANKPAEDFDQVSIRSIPTNPNNTVMTKGIENLLPAEVILQDYFEVEVRDDGNGKRVRTEVLDKVRLCADVCNAERNPEHFRHFAPVLDLISDVVALRRADPASSDGILHSADDEPAADDAGADPPAS